MDDKLREIDKCHVCGEELSPSTIHIHLPKKQTKLEQIEEALHDITRIGSVDQYREWLRYTLNEIKRLQDALTVAGKRIDSYQD